MVMILMVTSCDLLAGLFGDDWEPDPEAVERPDAKLSEQMGDTVLLEFNDSDPNSEHDLDWFYMYNYAEEGELPEWESGTDPGDFHDKEFLQPARDNNNYVGNNPAGASVSQADATWLIDLGKTFDFTYTFKTAENTSDYYGPNLSLRYEYNSQDPPEAGVISVMVWKHPDTGAYEFMLSHFDQENGGQDGFVNFVEPITQLSQNTWYVITLEISRASPNEATFEIEKN